MFSKPSAYVTSLIQESPWGSENIIFLLYLHMSSLVGSSFPYPLSPQVDHIVFENYQQLLCMEGSASQKTLKVATCNPMEPNQKWKFEQYYEG